MRDAFGGLVNLVIISIFLVIVSGFLAFNVNYTKAFRVKNNIISSFEQYEGNCNAGTECYAKIEKYMQSIGYSKSSTIKPNEEGFNCSNSGFCYKLYCSNGQNNASPGPVGSVCSPEKKGYYKIVTQINIDIPILNKIIPSMDVFKVYGNTRTIDAS